MAKTQSLAFLLIADDLQQFPKPFNRGKVDECYAIKRQNSQIAPQFPSSWAFSFQSLLPALLAYWPTGVLRFAFEGLQHVGEASLMVFIDRAIGCNDDHARQARRAERPEGFAVQID